MGGGRVGLRRITLRPTAVRVVEHSRVASGATRTPSTLRDSGVRILVAHARPLKQKAPRRHARVVGLTPPVQAHGARTQEGGERGASGVEALWADYVFQRSRQVL